MAKPLKRPRSPVMDRGALDEILETFQEELKGWLEKETVKLGKLQEHGKELEKRLETRRSEVVQFLKENGREVGEEPFKKLVAMLAKMLEEVGPRRFYAFGVAI